MKKLIAILYFFISSFICVNAQNVEVLVLLSSNYGGNTFLNCDNFERLGWNLTYTGVTQTVQRCANFISNPITVDVLVSDITDITQYDVLAIMPSSWQYLGANVYNDILNSPEALELVKSAVDSGLVVYSICAGPRILAAVNRLNGVEIVGKVGPDSIFYNEFQQAGAIFLGDDHPPVISGNIVTVVRDLHYHVQNIQAVATALENTQNLRSHRKRKVTDNSNFLSSKLKYNHKTMWTNTFGGENSEGGLSIYETNDEGFIICGYTYSYGAGNSDILLLKIDKDGSPVWHKTYGGTGWDFGYAAKQTFDGGYIITGYTTSYGAGSKDLYLIKTDSDGDTIWTKTIGGEGVDVGTDVIEMDDSTFIVCGYTESFGAGEDDFYFLKTDSRGDTLWTKTFGGERSETCRSVSKTDDDGLIFFGSAGSENLMESNRDMYLIKTDLDGNKIWGNNYNGDYGFSFDWGNSALQTDDGGYILIGDGSVNWPLDMYLIKTDSAGNHLWEKYFGGSFFDYGNSIVKSDGGGYLICGVQKNISTRKNDVLLIKTDEAGININSKSFGGSGAEWGSAIIKTSDGNYMMVGQTDSYGAGSFDVWFVKIDENLTGINELNDFQPDLFYLAQNYPNPFNPETKISYQIPQSGFVSLIVYDLLGNKVSVLVNEEKPAGEYEIVFNGTGLTSGVYLYQLAFNSYTETRKMCLLK